MDSRIFYEDLICPICTKVFEEPKLLPCAHRLCRKCLLDYVKSRTSNHCPCPLCKASFRGDRSYPTDGILQKLIQDRRDECRFHSLRRTRYCITCCLLACAECVIRQHKTCRDVVSVAGADQVMRQKLLQTKEDIDALICDLESAEENTDLKTEETVNFFSDMVYQLDKMQEALVAPIVDMRNTLNEAMESNVSLLKTSVKAMTRRKSRLVELGTSLGAITDIGSLDDESLFRATSDLVEKRGLLGRTRNHLDQSLDLKVASLKLSYKDPTGNVAVKTEQFCALTPRHVAPRNSVRNQLLKKVWNFIFQIDFMILCFLCLVVRGLLEHLQ
ncbi:tripartite motif-containing protein 59-like [Haliotis cracherodii]|uniref:tripartite motif-containing protein 59-like n=1 Tax=Haliotis cracherodii TaxID=6455 RepID=UPI0039EA4090